MLDARFLMLDEDLSKNTGSLNQLKFEPER